MSVFAIADLHLSHGREKPMDVFGPGWSGHVDRIKANWDRQVTGEDLVIIAGDISWAMRLTGARPDLEWIAARKGTKLLVRGNHDYWWSTIGKVRAQLPPTLHALQNDHFAWAGGAVCGTRGWICPGEEGFDNAKDQKIYNREAARLELSLQSARDSGLPVMVAALHFPPFNRRGQPSAFTALLESFGVRYCVFGHIHDSGRDHLFRGERNGVTYHFAAADGIDFTPLRLY